MKIAERFTRSRARKLQELIAEHPARDDASFRELAEGIAKSRPDESPAAHLQTAHYIWEFTEYMRAGQQERDRQLIAAERARIFKIISAAYGADEIPHDVRVGLSLAIDGDLDADASIRVLSTYIVNPPGVHQ